MLTQDIRFDRLTIADVARIVGVHRKTAERWALRGVRNKRLPSKLVGGRRYVLAHDLTKFLDLSSLPVTSGDE
jgi:hypothetical protein